MNPIITKIEPQKKNKNRVSIYSDNEFIIGISVDTLLKFNLQAGVEISEELINKIGEKENFDSLKNSAFRFLSRRQHSIKELRDKLFRKSKTSKLIDKVIKHLLDKRYLDDFSFAKTFLNEEIKLKKNGPLLIKSKLLRKGIKSETIELLISSKYSNSMQINNCKYLAEKKLNSLIKKSTNKNKKIKLINHLKQKGYDWETCDQVFNSIYPGGNEDEE